VKRHVCFFNYFMLFFLLRQIFALLKETKIIMTERFPVLVYGTLRPTGGNYEHFLEGYTTREEVVTITGFTMHAGMDSGFPYLVRGGDGTIVATLVYVDDEVYDGVIRGLDSLEGYDKNRTNNHYDRITHTFDLNGEEVTAWIYVAGVRVAEEVVQTIPVLADGDWLKLDAQIIAAQRAYRAYREGGMTEQDMEQLALISAALKSW
jgi:gamma-glutamylcyclotransferase (GGCT)/AIG2-like uncharacterized protein YtfP